jgi:hypothetical protein
MLVARSGFFSDCGARDLNTSVMRNREENGGAAENNLSVHGVSECFLEKKKRAQMRSLCKSLDKAGPGGGASCKQHSSENVTALFGCHKHAWGKQKTLS